MNTYILFDHYGHARLVVTDCWLNVYRLSGFSHQDTKRLIKFN